ncbi:MAG: MBL fold metallo-hydrolase [Bacillota bacterium]|nr:MBL fold metallo-hydrolase [Bacillota bacterium]
MQVTVLGCWAPYPAAHGACSGYLVEAGDMKILLDAGHGTFAHLAAAIDFRQLDLVVVSHYHPDHSADLPCLRHAIHGAINDGTREKKLRVYAPKEPGEEFERLQKMRDGLDIRGIDDIMKDDNGVIAIPEGFIKLFRTNHPLPTYGSEIIHKEAKLVYSADTGASKELRQAAALADLLICEASLLEEHKEYGALKGHLTSREAALIAKEANVKNLLITHLWPEYDLSRLLQEAQELFPNTFLAAEKLVRKI